MDDPNARRTRITLQRELLAIAGRQRDRLRELTIWSTPLAQSDLDELAEYEMKHPRATSGELLAFAFSIHERAYWRRLAAQ